MVRTVYSPEYCKEYLEKCAEKEPLIVGLILGQIANSRENVIYLARTPQEKTGDNVTDTFKSKTNFNLFNVSDISEEWVADHAKHVTRMLPGGMFVQGIFIIIEDEIFEKSENFVKIRSTIKHLYNVLITTNYMYGFCPTQKELLVLHMGRESKVITCKSIEIGTGTRMPALKPVDWKFLPKPQQWQRLDCYYEFDEIYPIIIKNGGISVKQQFQQILETAHKAVDSSVMFIDGELRNGIEELDELNQKKKSKSSGKTSHTDVLKTMQVSLFVPFENTLPETVEYLECDGNVHFSGVVSSSVFLYPKATVSEAIAAVKQDIVRSLASRFTMHCDALIDDNLLPEEKVCFNEPPRRVLVPVGSLYLCDYLFPGEAPAEALLSVKELLDLQLKEEDVICDVETPADTSEFDALDRDASSEEMLATPKEASQFMYITGICFAMFVLIVSIVVHYYDTLVTFVSKLFK